MNDLHRQLDIFAARKKQAGDSRELLIRLLLACCKVLIAQCGVDIVTGLL